LNAKSEERRTRKRHDKNKEDSTRTGNRTVLRTTRIRRRTETIGQEKKRNETKWITFFAFAKIVTELYRVELRQSGERG
jgi:hypothetical protein